MIITVTLLQRLLRMNVKVRNQENNDPKIHLTSEVNGASNAVNLSKQSRMTWRFDSRAKAFKLAVSTHLLIRSISCGWLFRNSPLNIQGKEIKTCLQTKPNQTPLLAKAEFRNAWPKSLYGVLQRKSWGSEIAQRSVARCLQSNMRHLNN